MRLGALLGPGGFGQGLNQTGVACRLLCNRVVLFARNLPFRRDWRTLALGSASCEIATELRIPFSFYRGRKAERQHMVC